MSQVNLNDDFFSPIRLNASTVDSSDVSEGSLTELLGRHVRFSLSESPKNDKVFEEKKSRHDESDLKDEKSMTQNSVPASNKNSKNSLNSSKLSLDKMQLMKKRETKHNSKREDSESFHLKKDSLPQESYPNDQNCKSSTTSKSSHKTSRPTTLLPPKEEVTKTKAPKEVKKKQKSSQALKVIDSITDVHGTNNKDFSEKKIKDSSLQSEKNSKNLKSEDLVKSIESKKKSSSCESTSEQLSDSTKQEQLELISNPVQSQYQASVEKIIQDCISTETAKIRQSMYLQQMNFYRQMHKIKCEMELQHLETNKRLFGIAEELGKMNNTLKSLLTGKKQ